MMRRALLIVALVIPVVAIAQGTDGLRKGWSEAVEPFNVIGPIYYVGAGGISSHVIDTGDGLILIDAGTKLMPRQIVANLETLGYEADDVKVILSSHAHWDHVEGLAEMKRLTGGQVVALGEDAAAIASGVDNSALGGDGWEAVAVDREIVDGDTVDLGNITMTARHTPGHTKGCTTWTTAIEDGGTTYEVVFIGGTSVNFGVPLRDNARHPGIAEDYQRTFEMLAGLECDVFLAQHPFMHQLDEKRAAQLAGAERNPFIDPEGYKAFVRSEREKFEARLAREDAE